MRRRPTKRDTIHLEDTLTQATDAVRETFTKHKTTLVVVLVVLVGGFGLWKLIGARNVAALDDVNARPGIRRPARGTSPLRHWNRCCQAPAGLSFPNNQ